MVRCVICGNNIAFAGSTRRYCRAGECKALSVRVREKVRERARNWTSEQLYVLKRMQEAGIIEDGTHDKIIRRLLVNKKGHST